MKAPHSELLYSLIEGQFIMGQAKVGFGPKVHGDEF